jgi:hypothetical protein
VWKKRSKDRAHTMQKIGSKLAIKYIMSPPIYSGVLCLLNNKHFSTIYPKIIPPKHMGIAIGIKGVKKTEHKIRLEVFASKLAISSLGPS